MTRYFRDWEFDTIGSAASGLTRRGGGSHTMVPAYGTPPYKRAYAAQTTDNTGDYRSFSLDVVDADANRANANQVMLFKFDDATVEQVHIYCRGAGTSSVTDFYRVRLTLSSGALRIDKMAASAYTADIGTATVTVAAGKSYFVRFDAQSTALKAKVWDAALGMAGEPAAWDINITDASVAGAGWVAIGGRHTTLTGKVIPINAWAVASNGDSAIAPRTNAEFLAWISKPNLRCVLAEMQGTGYDSSGSPYTKTIKAYVANHGFTSAQQDTPANQHYDAHIASIPTFSRQMGADLVGPVSVGFGDLVLRNKAEAPRLGSAGYAVQCDGVDDYVSVPDSTSLHLGTGSMTFECWATILSYPPVTKAAGVMAKGGGTGRIWIFLDGNSNKVVFNCYFGVGLDFYITPSSAPSAGRHHFALVVDRTAGMQYAYIDGVQVGSNNVSAAAAVAFDAVSNLNFGGTISTGIYGNVVIDEARVWNVARNAGQIARYMNRSPIGNETGLVSCWHFDEGAGTSALDANKTNANNGTLAGGATWVSGIQLLPWSDDNKARLDDWLRVRWSRNYLTLLIGDPSWPRHDFRALMVGRLGQPTAPAMDVLKFPIADLMDSMNVPIQTRYTSGALSGQFKPAMIGDLYGGCEPPLEDASTLTYKLSDQAITYLVAPAGTDGEQSIVVYDNGVDVSTDNAYTGLRKTVTAVNAATDTLTSAGHGMLADAQVVFYSGTPPAPLTTFTSYYVISAGLTTDDFRLAVTRGGAAINITGTTTGAAFRGTNYKVDFANATLTLLATPAGRVTVYGFRDDSYTEWTIGRLYEEVVFNRGGVSLNFKDSPAFTAMHTTCTGKYYGGVWLDGNTMRTAFDVCQQISTGSLSWFGFTFDGLMQVGMISLPAASAVRSFSAADVLSGSLKMNSRIRARNYTNAIITLAPWFLKSGGIPGPNPALARGYTIGTPNAYAAAGTPLDDHPDQLDAAKTDQVDTIVATTDIIENILKGVFKKDLGLFEFRTTLAALWHATGPLSIGDTISLEHPRLGWKQYTAADPASPDNTATIDARLAVVMGMDVNLSAPAGQQVTLKVFRQIPGYFPTANLN